MRRRDGFGSSRNRVRCEFKWSISPPWILLHSIQALEKDQVQVEIVVNNAGIAGVSQPLWECSRDEWREVIELDLTVFHVCNF